MIYNNKAAYYNGTYEYAQGNKVYVSDDIFTTEDDQEWDIVHISEITFSTQISIPTAPIPSLFKAGDTENPLIVRRSNFHYPVADRTTLSDILLGKSGEHSKFYIPNSFTIRRG